MIFRDFSKGLITVDCELPWWSSSKESSCQCRSRRFDPWVGKTPLEKEIATHSSIVAWKIPWTVESGGLQSMESQRVGLDLGTKQQQQQQIVECSKSSISRVKK